jgi:hypothetical protein
MSRNFLDVLVATKCHPMQRLSAGRLRHGILPGCLRSFIVFSAVGLENIGGGSGRSGEIGQSRDSGGSVGVGGHIACSGEGRLWSKEVSWASSRGTVVRNEHRNLVLFLGRSDIFSIVSELGRGALLRGGYDRSLSYTNRVPASYTWKRDSVVEKSPEK